MDLCGPGRRHGPHQEHRRRRRLIQLTLLLGLLLLAGTKVVHAPWFFGRRQQRREYDGGTLYGPAVYEAPPSQHPGFVELSVAGLLVRLRDALDPDLPLQPEERVQQQLLELRASNAPPVPSGEGALTDAVRQMPEPGAVEPSGVSVREPLAYGEAADDSRRHSAGEDDGQAGPSGRGGRDTSLWSWLTQSQPRSARREGTGAKGARLAEEAAGAQSPAQVVGEVHQLRFLVAVTSTVGNPLSAKRRAGARATWVSYMRQHFPNVEVKFVLAQPVGSDRRAAVEGAAAELGAEAARHGDLVVVRGAEEYRNLPNKTLRIMAYMLSAAAQYTHVLKTDDDCYVRFQNILYALRPFPQPDMAPHVAMEMRRLRNPLADTKGVRMNRVYTGCLENQHGFYPLRDPKSKWFISWEEMSDEVVPWEKKYLAGWGYVLSRDVVEHVVLTTQRWQEHPSEAPGWYPGLHWEDVLVGLLAGDVVGDEPQNHESFVAAWKTCGNYTAVRHLDTDAPNLFKGLHEQELNEVWATRTIQCASGDFESDNYWAWKNWRDSLPNVLII